MTAVVGIDVGGTKIAAGWVDAAGTLSGYTRSPAPQDSRSLVSAIVQAVDGARAGRAVSGVGIAAAGFVSSDQSTVLMAPNLPWRDEPLAAQVQQEVGLPVVIENDGNAAAWAEHRFGAGAERDLVCVTVGTGIGGGLVLGGRLVRGRWGLAAELGHLCVVPGGRRCGCGQRGCWEQYASGRALVREARERAEDEPDRTRALLALGDGTPAGIEGGHVTRAAARGDGLALEVVGEIARWTAWGIWQVRAVLAPPLVVLGGGVAEEEVFVQHVREALAELAARVPHRNAPEVRAALLGNQAGVIGAADLARG